MYNLIKFLLMNKYNNEISLSGLQSGQAITLLTQDNIQERDQTSKKFIIKSLTKLKYPQLISDEDEFILQLISPSNLRYNTIEWLFNFITFNSSSSLIEKIYSQQENLSNNIENKIEVFFFIVKFIDLEFPKNKKAFSDGEYKKSIAGLGSTADSLQFIVCLIEFISTYYETLVSKRINHHKEISQILQMITFLTENKKDIFKEKVRLFAPEIRLIKDKKTEESVNESKLNQINTKEINEKIKEYEKTKNKLEKKLAKLREMDLNFELVERDEVLQFKSLLVNFEKSLDNFIKIYNNNYSSNIKYISEDKISDLHEYTDNFLSKYDVLLNLANSLEEIFALHNKLINL
jgi:hypothetical protein